MTPIDLVNEPRKIVMSKAAELDDVLPKGLDLVKQVYERALNGIANVQRARTHQLLDAEEIKSVKDIAATLVDIEKAERDRKRADKFNGKLDGMNEEELWKIINQK